MKIAVIFCTWNRVYRLENTLNDLKNQTYCDFDIFIWNNNKLEVSNIENIIKKQNKQINVHHSENNIGGIGRFVYAKEISNNYDTIIFIDDDQTIGNDVIEKMVNNYKENTILSWWGWKIKNDYWDRDRVFDFSEVDYCGTGGMILNSNIFNKIDLQKIPDKYKFIEDLWISFVAKYEYGYKLIGGNFNISINKDGNDQYIDLKPLKNEFYHELNLKYKNNDFKLYFIIPSYNRYDKLTNLITQIENDTNCNVIIYNDGSNDERYKQIETKFNKVKVIHSDKNNGKSKYNETISTLFNSAINSDGDYFVLLADDFILCKSFVQKLKPFLNEENIVNVFSIRPEGWGKFGWVDGALATSKNGISFLKSLIPNNLKNIEGKSTGVWVKITNYFSSSNIKYKLTTLNYSLCQHDGNDDSKLHPKHRLKVPIIALNFYDDFYGEKIKITGQSPDLIKPNNNKKKSSEGTSGGNTKQPPKPTQAIITSPIVIENLTPKQTPKPTQAIITSPIVIEKPKTQKEDNLTPNEKPKGIHKVNSDIFMGKAYKKKLRFGKK
jgi:GT2 family glycosyltransferase